jgi:uncharacterized protein (DUF58 family)
MTRLRMVLALGILALIGALVTGRDMFYQLTYAIVAMLILSLFWAWTGVGWVRFSRKTRARRAQVGRPLEERLAVLNTGRLLKLWLEVRDESNLPGHRAGFVVSNLTAHAERGWSVRTTCQERGRFTLGPVTLTSGDPFGLFRVSRKVPATSTVVVYPATVDLRQFPLPVGQLPGGDALRRRTHYVTTNASGVRDYAPGDGFNRIHWPSTARRDRLIVKEFELDPLSDVWVILDMHRDAHYDAGTLEWRQRLVQLDRMPPWSRKPHRLELPPSTEEYVVTAAASIAQYFLRRDRALGLVAVGQRREVVQADRGERQLTKVLETLAALHARGDIPLAQVLTAEAMGLARGTTLIIASSSVDMRWPIVARHLDRSGLNVVSVLVDPQSFGGPPGIGAVAAQFTMAAIPAYVIRKGDVMEEVLGKAVPLRRAV